MKTKAIIWDWNGTLLDDTDICLMSINKLLSARNKATISKDRYRQIFTFPVKEYYKAAGFDFKNEDFDIPALEFIDIYYSNLDKLKLFDGALNALKNYKEKGIKQYILSATEHTYLQKTIGRFQLEEYFEKIMGIGDHYAHSKSEQARILHRELQIKPDEFLYVGDTLHDIEIGEILGCKTILATHGHQSPRRFPERTSLIESLQELDNYII